jgi:hypothetical protein
VQERVCDGSCSSVHAVFSSGGRWEGGGGRGLGGGGGEWVVVEC